MTTAFITGANSGIGRSAAVDLATKGWTVYGSMRDLAKGEKLAGMADAAGVTVHPVVCDVTDTDAVNAAIGGVIDDAGGIDVLINNAGIGGNGVLEETTIESYAEVMDVNLHGIVRCCQAALPHMRKRGSGTIVNVSSIAGRIAALAQSPYVTSKWAVEGLTEGLAQEVAPFGIRVVLIEPGIVKTAIMAKNTDGGNGAAGDAYAAAYRRMFNFYAAGLADPGMPSEVADVIHEAVTTDSPKLRWTCGWGGAELQSRPFTDAEWVALGAIEDDAAYAAEFERLFGLKVVN